MTRRLPLLCAALACVAAAAITLFNSRSAKEKIGRIAEEKMPAGTTVVLTEDEINSYLRYDYADQLPAGLSDPNFRLEPDRVTGSVTVDFLEWQMQKGAQPGLLLSWLLRGKRRVEAVSRWTSANGKGQADIESVRIGAVPISSSAVTFLIENLVQPRYPDAVVGRPVSLGFHLKQVRIEQGRVMVVK